MRAMIIMCLAWGILIYATPGIVDRYQSQTHGAAPQITFGGGTFAARASNEGQFYPAAYVRVDCGPGENGVIGGAGNMSARPDRATGFHCR